MFDIVVPLTRTRLVPYLIAGPLLVLTFLSLVPASLSGAQGGKTEVLSVQKNRTGGSLHRDARERSGVTASIAGQKRGV